MNKFSWRRSLVVAALLAASLAYGVLAPSRPGAANVDSKEIEALRRLVALTPSLTEIVFDLGKGYSLVGVSMCSDYPLQTAAIPKVGSYVRPDIEKIVALRPDLCLALAGHTPHGVIDKLRSLGLRVVVFEAECLEDVAHSLESAGRLLGASSRGRELSENLRRRMDEIGRQAALRLERPRVFYQIGADPLITAGSKTFIHELLVTAGGANIAGKAEGYHKIGLEEILASAPQVILASSRHMPGCQERLRKQWAKWTTIPAVRDGRLYCLEGTTVERPTPRLAEGLELLAGLIRFGRKP